MIPPNPTPRTVPGPRRARRPGSGEPLPPGYSPEFFATNRSARHRCDPGTVAGSDEPSARSAGPDPPGPACPEAADRDGGEPASEGTDGTAPASRVSPCHVRASPTPIFIDGKSGEMMRARLENQESGVRSQGQRMAF